MDTRTKALEVGMDVDLRLFSGYLRRLGIVHRIVEAAGRQQLLVQDDERVEEIKALYRQLEHGTLKLRATDPVEHRQSKAAAKRVVTWHLKNFPGTLFFIAMSLACYPLGFGLDVGEVTGCLHYFTFVDFAVVDDRLMVSNIVADLSAGEIWRLWTPMLLHFSLLHLVFNLLWIWEIGRRIEIVQGTTRIFNLVMITGAVSNLAQYIATGGTIFGGMSGVVYGLLGYSLVWSRARPEQSLQLPGGIYIFMLVWLALGMVGFIDTLGLGSIANSAHLGGLIVGLLCGALAVAVSAREGVPRT